MKHNLILVFLLAIGLPASAQYAADAIIFSQPYLSSTARYEAIGGAQTALGGDLGSLFGNPAGVGMFRKSDISFSIRYNNTFSGDSFMGEQPTKTNLNKTNFANVGVVMPLYTNRPYINGRSDELVGINFGVGYNRSNDFYSNSFYQGHNPNSSITESMAEQANIFGKGGSNTLPGYLQLAYQAYLINPIDNLDGTTSYEGTSNGNVNQSGQIYKTGGQSTTNLNLSANYGNKLYFGTSLSILGQKYTNRQNFYESGVYSTDPTAPQGNVTSLNQAQHQNVAGNGVSGNFGTIYRANEALNIGFSMNFPVAWKMYENYSYDVTAKNMQGGTYAGPTVYQSYFNYKLRVPIQYSVGASYFFEKKAFISGDIQFVNYANLNFSSSDVALNRTTNQEIEQNYRSVVNYKVGGEYRLHDQFSLRAGVAGYGNPYTSRTGLDGSKMYYTGGFGYRIKTFYVDVAYMYSSWQSEYVPYTLSNNSQPTVNTNQHQNSLTFTIGTKI